MPIPALKLLSNPGAIADRPLIVLHGDNAYLLHEAQKCVLQAVMSDDEGLASARFEGDTANLADVLDEVRTLPFLSRSRAVLVEAADPFVTRYRRELETYTEHPSRSGVLILEVRTWAASTNLAKLVEKMGLAVDCKSPPEREIQDWLKRLAQERYEAKLTPDAALLLLELVGPEMGLLASEIEKLSTAVASKGTIEASDVARNVGAGRVETIWKALDAATTGRGAEALVLIDRLIDSGEHPVGLLAAMVANLRKLHHAGELRRGRVAPAEACKLAGIPSFRDAIDKTVKQHAHLGPSRVSQLPAWTLQADLDLKGFSTLPPRVILERLLVRLSLPRRD